MDDRISELEAEIRELRNALVDTASTAEQALGRLLLMSPVVEAAQHWCHGGSHAQLTDAVNDYNKQTAGRQ